MFSITGRNGINRLNFKRKINDIETLSTPSALNYYYFLTISSYGDLVMSNCLILSVNDFRLWEKKTLWTYMLSKLINRKYF